MDPSSPEFVIISSGGVMILILLSLIGNILVCCAVYQSRQLRTRVNYLIVSLAIADIMIASISMPIWMYSEITAFRFISGESAYRLMMFWNFIDIFGGIASITNLTVISYERLWSVCSPLKHRRYLTNLTLGIMIMVAWGYALIVAITTLVWFELEWCILYNAIVGFFLPLVLIINAYFFIFIIVKRSPRNIISSKENTRINVTICIIVGLFFTCWAPHFIASLLSRYNEKFHFYVIDNIWIRSLIKWLHYANSFINPVVYGLANAQYKEAFKLVFKKMCRVCFFNRKYSQSTLQSNKTKTPTPLSSPIFARNKTDKELRVELSIEEKEEIGANGGGIRIRNENPYEEYLPGDYRALPMYLTQRDRNNYNNTSRWTSQTSETYLTGTSPCEDSGLSPYEDSAALKKALLNPESLSRTSYI